MIADKLTHSILIVSSTDKGKYLIKNLLLDNYVNYQMRTLSDSSEARRELLQNDYDVVIINSPLQDELGDNLALHIKEETNSEVLLLLKNESYDVISDRVMDYGVLTITKPIIKALFFQTLNIAIATSNKRKEYELEVEKMKLKMDEIVLISKAKCILIEKNQMSEDEAHKYIEKTAMNTRKKRGEVAEEILKIYMK